MSGAGMAGVTYFASNKDDPYVTLKNPVSEFCKLCYTLFAIHVILNFHILMQVILSSFIKKVNK